MNLWLMALIVAAAAGIAVGLMYLVRRRSRLDHFFVEVERGAGIFTFLGTAFAVLLAFVVLEAFRASTTRRPAPRRRRSPWCSSRARPRSSLPAERDPLEGTLICYGQAVIHDEWPAMKDGDRSPVVQGWVNRLEDGLQRLPPGRPCPGGRLPAAAPAGGPAHRRPPRAAQRGQPLIAGAGLVLPRPRGVRDGRVRALLRRPARGLPRAGSLIGAIAALVVSGLLLVWFLDHPYENRAEASSRTRWSASW